VQAIIISVFFKCDGGNDKNTVRYNTDCDTDPYLWCSMLFTVRHHHQSDEINVV